MRTLVDIGADYGSDKGTFHQYFEVYDTLLTRHRRTARRVAEIGVHEGESLRVWAEAFPQAQIIGIDPNATQPTDGAYTVIQVDAYRPHVVQGLAPCDIIIDDGPHTLESMLFVAEHYPTRLCPGGTLVIEDIPTMNWVRQITDRVPDRFRRHCFVIDRRIAPISMGEDILFVIDIVGPPPG